MRCLLGDRLLVRTSLIIIRLRGDLLHLGSISEIVDRTQKGVEGRYLNGLSTLAPISPKKETPDDSEATILFPTLTAKFTTSSHSTIGNWRE
jgi:hypothetical protein